MVELIENLKSKFNQVDDESKNKIKKLGILFLIIAVVIVVIIIVVSIVLSIINRKYSYEDTEVIMKDAAISYFENNISLLPSAEIGSTVVEVQKLVEEEYMKELSKLTKNDTCTGKVVVKNDNGTYNYQAFLTCNDYATTLLKDEITKNNSIVESGDGLYNENGLLRFRGEIIKNYLKVEDTYYQIMKIDNEGRIFITPNELRSYDENYYVYWDNRYNSEKSMEYGINEYNLSRIKLSLDNIYNNLISDSLKEHLTSYTSCIAKRGIYDSISDGTIECAVTNNNQFISLIPTYEYIKASTAPACVSINNKECGNYNYLLMKDQNWWTATGNSANTYESFIVRYNGSIEAEYTSTMSLARYVIALKGDTLLKKGSGTYEDPYEIR